MLKRILVLIVGIAILTGTVPGSIQAIADASDELQQLVDKVNERLGTGARTAEALADEIKAFDALYEKYKSEKTGDVAQILFMKAMLYVQVFDDAETAMAMLETLKTEFPDTEQGKNATTVIEQLKAQAESAKIRNSLVVGAKFPDFDEVDLDGNPLSISRFKGKPVLIDFWATWCGPCVRELPNVIAAYDKYHEKGFDIIGISLDRSKTKLTTFAKRENMSWPQYFDGLGWENKLAQKYGVQSIPATYLLDGNGIIIAKDLRGNQLMTEVGRLLD